AGRPADNGACPCYQSAKKIQQDQRGEDRIMRAQSITRRACLLSGLAGAAFVAAGGACVWAQDADVIQSQDTNIGGIVSEIIQCKRKNGVLTIKMRLRNTGDKKKGVSITDGGAAYDKYYLTAGDKKYFILRDSEK